MAWKEDVELTSGKIVTVKRTAKTKPFGEVGGPGGWENLGMTVEIVDSPNIDKPPKWNFPFVPVVFDQDSKTRQWLMVATFYSCTSWYDIGRPVLPYVEYRIHNGKWVNVPLSKDLIGRKANMYPDIRSDRQFDVTIPQKNRALSRSTVPPKFKEILAQWKTTC